MAEWRRDERAGGNSPRARGRQWWSRGGVAVCLKGLTGGAVSVRPEPIPFFRRNLELAHRPQSAKELVAVGALNKVEVHGIR